MKDKKKLQLTAIAILIAIASIFIYKGVIAQKLYDKYFNLGIKYLMSEDYDESIKEFNKAKNKKEKSTEVRLYLAKAYIGNNDINKAIETLEEVQSIDLTNEKLLKEILIILNQIDSDILLDFLNRYIDDVGEENISNEIKEIIESANEAPSKPKVNYEEGKYTKSIVVKLDLDKIKIGHNYYYTLDGSNPSRSSKKYVGQIKIVKTTILKIIGYNKFGESTDIITLKYTIDNDIVKDIDSLLKESEELLNTTQIGTNKGNTSEESKEKFNKIIDKVKKRDLLNYNHAKEVKEEIENALKEFKNSIIKSTDKSKLKNAIIKPTDKSKLKNAINKAQDLYDNSVEGNEEGKYKAGSKSILLKSINNAKSVNSDNMANQRDIDNETQRLNSAINKFKKSKNSKGNSTNKTNFTESQALKYAKEYRGKELRDEEYSYYRGLYEENPDEYAEYIDDRYSHLSGDVCGRQYIVQSGKLTNGNKCYYIIEVYEDFYENIYGYYQQLKVYENGQIEILDEGTTLG